MVIDYKSVTFSFKARKKKRILKRIRLFGLVVFILCFYFLFCNILDSSKIKNIQKLLLENEIAKAEEKFEKIEGSIYHKKAKREIKALIHLFKDELDIAREILVSLKTGNTSVTFGKFLEYFSDYAEYRKLKIYTDYLVKRGENLLFYKALYSTALLDFEGSFNIIKKMPPEKKEKYKKELAIIQKTNNELKTGKINYIFDVNGIPMAYYDLKKQNTFSLIPGMTFHKFNKDFKKRIKFYSTTIDFMLQKKIHQLFRANNYHGSFLLFNLNDTSISAAYSRPLDRRMDNYVFFETFEPGSIIKLLTLYSYLQSDRQDLFPYQCKGNFTIKGQIFYDWIKHNTVKDYEEALTISCNISFAKMGIKLGVKELTETFEQFYFNSGDLEDLFLNFKMGTFNKMISGDLKLANFSVGLDEISITTFHSALISAIIVQNGSIYLPYLIKNKKNLLNLGYYNHSGRIQTISNASTTTFLKIKNGMIRVVEDERGTGRRSKVDFIRFGIKTGTSGNKKLGLDAIVIGFFPAERPKYAFGFRLERVGKAEVKGAFFLRDLLISFFKRRTE